MQDDDDGMNPNVQVLVQSRTRELYEDDVRTVVDAVFGLSRYLTVLGDSDSVAKAVDLLKNLQKVFSLRALSE